MQNVKDVLFKIGTTFHAGLFRLSGGKLLPRLQGMPVVMLTTTGRKTGRQRTTMLTAPVHDGDTLVLVASYGGDSRHPNWFLNARANPDVEVSVEGSTRPMRARVASAEEKAELWPRVTRAYRGYAQYQQRTDRDIPLLILEP